MVFSPGPGRLSKKPIPQSKPMLLVPPMLLAIQNLPNSRQPRSPCHHLMMPNRSLQHLLRDRSLRFQLLQLPHPIRLLQHWLRPRFKELVFACGARGSVSTTWSWTEVALQAMVAEVMATGELDWAFSSAGVGTGRVVVVEADAACWVF